jgi:hypothetical protein
MKHTYYPTTHTESLARRAIMSALGAIVITASGIILMLTYFDVLVK